MEAAEINFVKIKIKKGASSIRRQSWRELMALYMSVKSDV